MTDRKLQVADAGLTLGYYFTGDVIAARDYYPFGMLMPERNMADDGYRYGFNGKESDDEVSGNGNQYDYGFRIYNPRIGKFLSVDPLTASYPWYTPYQFAGNSPVKFIDLDGLEPVGHPNDWDVVNGTVTSHGSALRYGIKAYGQNGTPIEGSSKQFFWIKEMPNKAGKAGNQYYYGNSDSQWELFRDDEISRQHRKAAGEDLAKANATLLTAAPTLLLGGGYMTASFFRGAGINFGAQFLVHSGVESFSEGPFSFSNVLLNRIDYADVFLGGFGGGFSGSSAFGMQVVLPALVDYSGGKFTHILGTKSVFNVGVDGLFNLIPYGGSLLLGRLSSQALKNAEFNLRMEFLDDFYKMLDDYRTGEFDLLEAGKGLSSAYQLRLQSLHQSFKSINFRFDFGAETGAQAGSTMIKEE